MQRPWFADATDLDVIKAFRHHDEDEHDADDSVAAVAAGGASTGLFGEVAAGVIAAEGAGAATKSTKAAYEIGDSLFEVDVADEAAASSSAGAPIASLLCPDCPEPGCGPMSISDGSGHYSTFICNGCSGRGSGERWFCSTHRNDFCFTCNPGMLILLFYFIVPFLCESG